MRLPRKRPSRRRDILGKVHKHPIGAYTYQKRTASNVEACRVMVYRLDVENEAAHWREHGQRTRQWFPADEAARRVSEPGLASMILAIDQPQPA